mgnify:CR=1 FL=1
MYIEKRFLNVFLSVVLILCSLFSVQLISVSAEEKSNAKESNLTEAVLPELITSNFEKRFEYLYTVGI